MTDRSISQEINGKKLRAKIVLIGDRGVGKTTFQRIWLGTIYNTEYLMTIGADFASKEITFCYIPTKTTYHIRFQIWNLACQPRFKAINELYYQGANGALCFFDITNQKSYRNVAEWIKAFWSFNGRGIQPVMIVGTKSDLRENPTFPSQVTAKTAKIYARELSANVQPKYGFNVHYIESSVQDNLNVDELFRLLAYEIINHRTFSEKMTKR